MCFGCCSSCVEEVDDRPRQASSSRPRKALNQHSDAEKLASRKKKSRPPNRVLAAGAARRQSEVTALLSEKELDITEESVLPVNGLRRLQEKTGATRRLTPSQGHVADQGELKHISTPKESASPVTRSRHLQEKIATTGRLPPPQGHATGYGEPKHIPTLEEYSKRKISKQPEGAVHRADVAGGSPLPKTRTKSAAPKHAPPIGGLHPQQASSEHLDQTVNEGGNLPPPQPDSTSYYVDSQVDISLVESPTLRTSVRSADDTSRQNVVAESSSVRQDPTISQFGPEPKRSHYPNARPFAWPSGPMEHDKTVNFISENLIDFIDSMQLGDFYPEGDSDPYLREVCERGARFALANDETTTLNRPEDIIDMTRLALYDTVIYCDDSSSMSLAVHQGKRVAAMKELIRRVTKITSILDTSGIKIRCLNTPTDSRFNDIRTQADADRIINLIKFQGRSSKVGTALKDRILDPLLYEKINKKTFTKPLLIATITDGAPLKEDINHFKTMVLSCQNFLVSKNYKPTTVVFQVSQVGDEDKAEAFIKSLYNDPEVGGMVYCTSEKLDGKIEELRDNERNLERWLLDLLTLGIRPANT